MRSHIGLDMSKDKPEAVYVGNMMSGILSDQQHLGPLLATAAGLAGVEAFTAEVGSFLTSHA